MRTAVLLVCMLVLRISASAGDAITPAQALLCEALKTTAEAPSLKTVEKKTAFGASVTIERFQKLTPDGVTLKREDYTPTKLPKNIEITNRDGTWNISPKQVRLQNILKAEINAKRSIDPSFDQLPISDKNSFESQTLPRNTGTPLEKITMTLAPEVYARRLVASKAITEAIRARRETAFKKAMRSLGVKPRALPAIDPAESEPYVYEYEIDPLNKVIWGEKTYAKNGSLISSREFSEVSVGIPLSDDLFKVPKDIPVKRVNDYDSYFEIPQ